MKRKIAALAIAALLLTVLCPAGALAATFTIGMEPAQLEQAGSVTLNITMTNDGSAPMEHIFIGGPGVAYSADGKVIQPGESLYFPLKGVQISKDQIGKALVYTVRWDENGAEKSRDLTATVLAANQVALEAKRSADKTQSPTGGVIKLTYTLRNNGSVPIKNISITDKAVLPGKKIASGITLEGGAQQEIVYEYTMGEKSIVSKPVITYTTGESKEKTYSIPELALGLVNAKLVWEVTKGATTEQGTDFTILVTNNGNQTIKSIQLADEQGNKVNDAPFQLAIGEKKTLHHSVAADAKRTVVFTITGVDGTGEQYSDKSQAYEVRTYIDPNLMDLSVATEVVSPLNAAGSISLRFTLNNAGSVTMTNVVLSEEQLGELARIEEIAPGTQTVEKTLSVDGARQLVFALSALDPSGNPHEYIIKLNAQIPSAPPSASGPVTDGIEPMEEQAKSAAAPLTETLKTLAIVVAVLAVIAGAAMAALGATEKRNTAARRRGSAEPPSRRAAEHPVRERVQPEPSAHAEKPVSHAKTIVHPEPPRSPRAQNAPHPGQRTVTGEPYRPSRSYGGASAEEPQRRARDGVRRAPASPQETPRQAQPQNRERPDPKLPGDGVGYSDHNRVRRVRPVDDDEQ